MARGAESAPTTILPSVFHVGEQPEHRGQERSFSNMPAGRPVHAARRGDRLLPISHLRSLIPTGFEPPTPSPKPGAGLLESVEICCLQVIDIEPVAGRSLNAVAIC
jgi:hypothetical protein